MNYSENYKRIPGTKDYYISADGALFRRHGKYDYRLAPTYDLNGYVYTNLMLKNGSQKSETIHGLVAKHFLKKPKHVKNLEVNHKDGNKVNNDVSNLEWVSREENMRKGWENGQFAKVRKAIIKKRKSLNGYKTELTHDDVRQIRRLKKDMTLKQLGYIFSLHPNQISRICNYRSFADVR